MKHILILVFSILVNSCFCQISGIYTYRGVKYFPTEMHLKKDLTFLYYECLDKKHANGEYIETGNYTVQNDTLYLSVTKVGYSYDRIRDESIRKKAIFNSNNLYLLREDGTSYLKLTRKRGKFSLFPNKHSVH